MECKNRFEVFQSINDNPVEKCSKCNGKVRKIFNSTGIIFKGSGFYVNDYKKDENGKRTSPSTVKKDTPQKNGGCESCLSNSGANES
jgi:putative FmdB family regulatory protein